MFKCVCSDARTPGRRSGSGGRVCGTALRLSVWEMDMHVSIEALVLSATIGPLHYRLTAAQLCKDDRGAGNSVAVSCGAFADIQHV